MELFKLGNDFLVEIDKEWTLRTKAASGIYMIQNSINGNCYIGSAKILKDRFNLHRKGLINNTHHNIILLRAVEKYGISSFVFKVLELVEIGKLIEREQFYIDTLNPTYNICRIAGSSLGIKRNAEVCRNNRLGKKDTEETKGRKRQAYRNHNIANRKGQSMSDEARRKISVNSAKIWEGKKFSDKHRYNLSVSHKEAYKVKELSEQDAIKIDKLLSK